MQGLRRVLDAVFRCWYLGLALLLPRHRLPSRCVQALQCLFLVLFLLLELVRTLLVWSSIPHIRAEGSVAAPHLLSVPGTLAVSLRQQHPVQERPWEMPGLPGRLEAARQGRTIPRSLPPCQIGGDLACGAGR